MKNKIILIVSGVVLIIFIVVLVKVLSKDAYDGGDTYVAESTDSAYTYEEIKEDFPTTEFVALADKEDLMFLPESVHTLFADAKVVQKVTFDSEEILRSAPIDTITGDGTDMWYEIEKDGENYILFWYMGKAYYYNVNDEILQQLE